MTFERHFGPANQVPTEWSRRQDSIRQGRARSSGWLADALSQHLLSLVLTDVVPELCGHTSRARGTSRRHVGGRGCGGHSYRGWRRGAENSALIRTAKVRE
jgi:hypothetical protein